MKSTIDEPSGTATEPNAADITEKSESPSESETESLYEMSETSLGNEVEGDENEAGVDKHWTIMVYMAGDNNLSENMAMSLDDIRSFGQLMSPGDRATSNVLAFFDSSSLTVPTHYIDYSNLCGDDEPFRHPVERSDIVYPVRGSMDDPSEGNAASAYSILNFVHWCIRTRGRSAKKYALIFSAHSFGFYGTSFLRDDSSNKSMTLFKFRWALEQICEFYLGKEKIAILGFDSCVMSMLEVGYELREVAQTIIASEGSLPNAGWGYAPMLKKFIERPVKRSPVEVSATATKLGFVFTPNFVRDAVKKFVEGYLTQQRRMAIGGRSVDMSAWDLEKIEPIAAAVNGLASTLNQRLDLTEKIELDKLTNFDISVYQNLKKILLQCHFDAQTYMKDQSVDLKDFCQRLIIECKFMTDNPADPIYGLIRQRARAVIDAVEECVIKCGYSGDEFQFSNGISIYFPWTYITYMLTDYRYRYLSFVKGEKRNNPANPNGIGEPWNAFLHNYLTRVTLRMSRKNGTGNVTLLEKFDDQNSVWSKDNPPWSRDNPVWSKDNPPWSRDNPPSSKDNPPWSKDNPPWSKDNPPWSKDNPPWSRDNPPLGRGEGADGLFYFGRFKNFQLRWDVFGYADDNETGDNFV